MELRIINDLPVIVTRSGQKETLTPPAEVVAAARQRIQAAKAVLVGLEQVAADQDSKLEAALLGGENTQKLRAEQRRIADQITGKNKEIGDALADIAHVQQLLDQRRMVQLQLADQDAIAALVKPFESFLLEHTT